MVLTADALFELGHGWTMRIATEFPGAEVHTEKPIVWRNGAGQVTEGRIVAQLVLTGW